MFHFDCMESGSGAAGVDVPKAHGQLSRWSAGRTKWRTDP